MLKLLAYLKDIVTVCVFFYAISFYFKAFFQLNVFQVVLWWGKNFSSAEHGAPLIIGLFFSLLLSFVIWSSVIQKVYVSVLGETKSFLYVGNQTNSAYFIDPDNMNAAPFSASYVDKLNDTFENIYAKTYFVRDKGTERHGSAAKAFTWQHVFTYVAWGLLFTMILWVVLHNLGYQAYIATFYEGVSGAPTLQEAFNLQSQKVGLSHKSLAYVGIALSVLGFLGIIKSPAIYFGKPGIDISQVIYAGAHIEGKAVFAKKIFYTDELKETGVDTGNRYATFEFTQGLPTPVYVSLFFEQVNYPDLYTDIHQAIKTHSTMTFTLTSDLALELE